jgi:hypothetical protein
MVLALAATITGLAQTAIGNNIVLNQAIPQQLQQQQAHL